MLNASFIERDSAVILVYLTLETGAGIVSYITLKFYRELFLPLVSLSIPLTLIPGPRQGEGPLTEKGGGPRRGLLKLQLNQDLLSQNIKITVLPFVVVRYQVLKLFISCMIVVSP